MDTQILKLDKPYNYIYCNGSLGLHIATLIVSETKVNDNGEYQLETHSHPIVNYFNSPGGTVWNKAELRHCDIVCREDDKRVPLERIKSILKRQTEPMTVKLPGIMLNIGIKMSLKQYGIKVAWPVDEKGKELTEFDEKLYIFPKKDGKLDCFDTSRYFYFSIEATDQADLMDKLILARNSLYVQYPEHGFTIRFSSPLDKYKDLLDNVNKFPVL